MSPSSTQNRAQLRRIVAAGLAATLVALSGVVALAAYAVRAIDQAHEEAETRLVTRRVERSLELMRENVVSAAAWNDACVAMAKKDWAWAQVNLGDYYADYMKHEVTLAYGADGGLAYASRNSERVSLESEKAFADAARPLVDQVRAHGAAIKAAHRKSPVVGLDAVATREAMIDAHGVLYLVAASTVVPDDVAHANGLPFDPVVVSGRRVVTLLGELKRELLISGARLAPTDPRVRPSVTLKGLNGKPLAAIDWTPARPGLTTLARAAPWLLLVAVVLIATLIVGSARVISLMGRLDRNEAARDQALAQAQAAAEAKGQFLANMSHELRTPLNGVIAIAEVLRDRQGTAQNREMAALIVSSARVLEHLVSDVLDTAKIEAGRMTLEAASFDLRQLVRNVAELHAAAAAAKNLRLQWRVNPSAASCYLGDPTRLTQVLSNLLGNAVKFTARGGVRVTVRPVRGGLRFIVSDTGPGFDQQQASRLFRPFEQADASTTRRHGGTGLGLAICASLAQLMGGRISARSIPGRGSVFTVQAPLPIASCDPKDDGVEAPSDLVEPGTLGTRILLAEDHPTNQKVVAMILEPVGVELTIVDNGRAAVEAARAQSFDLILMDIQMPMMDGLTATGLIREDEQASARPKTPIVCLTANVDAAQVQACLAAGGDRHLAKPFRAEALLQTVFDLLSRDVEAA
jgi:signal transduction histidine kinase/ActR/RegA family two-component response regulator